MAHLHDELARNPARVSVSTPYGSIVGGRAANGAAIFLGNLSVISIAACVLISYRLSEIPYALPPGRFEDPVALPNDYRYDVKEYIQESICQSLAFYSFLSWL